MRHVALLLIILCLFAPLPAAASQAGAAGGDVGRMGTATTGAAVATTTPFDDRTTTFTISLQEDGDARWTVTVAYRLEDEEARRAFETYAAEYDANGSTTGPSADVFRSAAATASDATGREMAIQDVNRTAGFRNETTGVLTLDFRWTNFLETRSDGTLVLKDVLTTKSGDTWFRTLQSGQRLVIEPPSGYAATDVSVPQSRIVNRNIVVHEPSTFGAEDVSVTYEPTGSDDLLDMQVILGSVGLLALLIAAVYIVSRHPQGPWSAPGEDDGGNAVVSSGDSGGGAVPSNADSPAEGAASVIPDADDPVSESDAELLSDEERVERLLDGNGGRMRQADIVTETGWSDAKVSQLLSTMAENGEVEKLRLGRENLISLPDGEEEDDPRGNDA